MNNAMILCAVKRRELKRVVFFISLFLLIHERAKIREKITQVLFTTNVFFLLNLFI